MILGFNAGRDGCVLSWAWLEQKQCEPKGFCGLEVNIYFFRFFYSCATSGERFFYAAGCSFQCWSAFNAPKSAFPNGMPHLGLFGLAIHAPG